MAEEVAAIAVSFDHQISEGRVLRFQSGVAVDASAETLNALLDKLTSAADRQASRYELEAERKALAEEEKLYVMRREDLIRIDAEAETAYAQSGRRSAWSPDKLPPKDRQLREQTEIMERRLRESIAARRVKVEALTGVVNGAAHVATASH